MNLECWSSVPLCASEDFEECIVHSATTLAPQNYASTTYETKSCFGAAEFGKEFFRGAFFSKKPLRGSKGFGGPRNTLPLTFIPT